jgi:Peptidase family S41
MFSRGPRLFLIEISPSLRVRPENLLTILLADYNSTSTPSPISQIDGQDVIEFLEKEADRLAYHDPDTRWNALFYRLAAQTYGSFTSPRWYPGPTTTLLFENGTEQTRTNRAILIEPSAWSGVFDEESFYYTFVDATAPRNLRREETLKTLPHIPKRLQHVREVSDDGNAEVVLEYPEPDLTGASEVYINGYFVDHPTIKNLAVLSLQTFNTDSDADARQFQAMVQQFLEEAKSRGSEKVIIDLQSNGGGRVFLGYDVFRQASRPSASRDEAQANSS